jgi:dolichol kinase
MGIRGPKVNMTWNNTPHHHITFFVYLLIIYLLFYGFLDHGVTNYILVVACYDKFTCCEKK